MCMCVDIRKTEHAQYKELHRIKSKVNVLLPANSRTTISACKSLEEWNRDSLTDWARAESLLESYKAEDAAAATTAAGAEEDSEDEDADESDGEPASFEEDEEGNNDDDEEDSESSWDE